MRVVRCIVKGYVKNEQMGPVSECRSHYKIPCFWDCGPLEQPILLFLI